jgi:hypothetical protein
MGDPDAVFHIYTASVDHIEKNGLMSSIVSGFKYPTRESPRARDRSAAR